MDKIMTVFDNITNITGMSLKTYKSDTGGPMRIARHVLVALIAATAMPAFAEDLNTVYLGAGLSSPVKNIELTDTGNDAGAGLAASARWLRHLSNGVSAGAEFSYLSIGDKSRSAVNQLAGSLGKVYAPSFLVRYAPQNIGRLLPYVTGGLGLNGTSETSTKSRPLEFQGNLGFGIEAGNRFKIGIEMRTFYLLADANRTGHNDFGMWSPIIWLGYGF